MAAEARVWLDDNRILHVQYPQNFNLTLDVMERVHEQRLEIIDEPCPVPVYADSVASAEYEAQQFASREDIAELVPGMAIIVKSAFTRAMADLFMRFHRPPYPVQFFKDADRALPCLRRILLTIG
jgi:hypothetical protein